MDLQQEPQQTVLAFQPCGHRVRVQVPEGYPKVEQVYQAASKDCPVCYLKEAHADLRYHAAVRRAIEQADRGELVDNEQVVANFERKRGVTWTCEVCGQTIQPETGYLICVAVKWLAMHQACDPRPSSGAYRIPLKSCATEGDLLEWTLHLMNQNWFAGTNWEETVRSAWSLTGF